MAPEDIAPRLNALIDQSDILDGHFSVEAALMLAASMVRNQKLGTALAWSSLGYSAGSRIWKQYKKHQQAQRREYVLKVSVDDPIFDTISRWILQDTPEAEQYTVEASRIYRAKKNNYDDDEALAILDEIFGVGESDKARSGPTGDYQNLALEVDDDRPMILTVDGHELRVSFILPGQEINRQNGSDVPEKSVPDRYRGDPHFLVTCPSLAARKALLAKIDESFKSDEKRLPSVYRATSYGEMTRSGDVPLRKLDSVIIKPGQLEALVEDIAKFLGSEDYHVDLGIPYHHGILLYGPPGTGKTSIAAAVATALNLDVYAVQLSNITDDATLIDAFRAVKPRSVLLLEDIDTYGAARGEDGSTHKGATIDGLLQALDGFASPHGLITLMTTNNPDDLDERVVREGRIDTRMEIDCVDTDQVERLCQKFIGYIPDGIPELVPSDMVSPAKVVGVFKTFLYDRQSAGPALVKRLNELLEKRQDGISASGFNKDTLMRLRKPELQQVARNHGITFTSKTSKADLVSDLLTQ